MSLRLKSFGSGSSGNAYLLSSEEGNILIDAGVAIRRFKKELQSCGLAMGDIDAILLTHDHADHANCIGTIQQEQRKAGHNVPIYATAKTMKGVMANPTIRRKPVEGLFTPIQYGDSIELMGWTIHIFHVPHDSNDNVGYSFERNGIRLCLVTDAGQPTPEVLDEVKEATHLVLEANYDTGMLVGGRYPQFLINRIRGGRGHLSNDQAAEILFANRAHLQYVWLCHLSENNNTPIRALNTVRQRFEQENERTEDYFHLEALPRKVMTPYYILKE